MTMNMALAWVFGLLATVMVLAALTMPTEILGTERLYRSHYWIGTGVLTLGVVFGAAANALADASINPSLFVAYGLPAWFFLAWRSYVMFPRMWEWRKAPQGWRKHVNWTEALWLTLILGMLTNMLTIWGWSVVFFSGAPILQICALSITLTVATYTISVRKMRMARSGLEFGIAFVARIASVVGLTIAVFVVIFGEGRPGEPDSGQGLAIIDAVVLAALVALFVLRRERKTALLTGD